MIGSRKSQATASRLGGGADGRRTRLPVLAVSLLVLGGLVLGVSLAAAAAPTLVIGTAGNPTYTTVDISGELDAHGEESNWNIQYSSDGTNWNYSNLSGQSFGTQPEQIPPGGGTIEGLQAGTTYTARVHVERFSNGFEVEEFNSDPSAPFTTESIPAPTVTIDPVTTFTGATAHLSGRIEPNPPVGDPSASNVDWHFECSPECPGEEGPANPGLTGGTVEAGAVGNEQIVTAEAARLEPNTEYTVRLIGKNAGEAVEAGPVTFTTSAVAPALRPLAAFAIEGGTKAQLGVSINPRNSATTYRILFGTTTAYGRQVEGSAGSGAQAQPFAQEVGGLAPETVYHFKAIAEGGGTTVEGRDMTFETAPAGPEPEQSCPNAALRAENGSTSLPECRAYEQVSPTDKNGYDAVANSDTQTTFLQANTVAAQGGGGIFYEAFGAFADSEGAAVQNQYISRRGEDGWATTGLTPQQHIRGQGNIPWVTWLSPDLKFITLRAGQTGHLAAGDDPTVGNWYRLETSTRSYQTLNPGTTVNQVVVGGGSTDGRRVFFYTEPPEKALTPEAAAAGVQEAIYEWHDGQLKLASIFINSGGQEEAAPYASFNRVQSYPNQNQVSADGSRIVFRANVEGGSSQVYLREDGLRTLHVSASRGGSTTESELGVALFQGASVDDSKVFFSTTDNLTPDAAGSGDKLYCFEPETETLTNLLAGALPGSSQRLGRSAGPYGEHFAVGISQDGEYAYFFSPTQFHAGDSLEGGAALYVWHDGAVTFIAPDDDSLRTEANNKPARVSPDGTRLSFSSTARLTAYDNTDSVPAADGSARQDTEVYVYDAVSDRLVCVSCNPAGRRPAGAPEGGPAADSMLPEPPTKQFLNPQPGVRDDGAVFFDSRDALVPQDVNGKADVYLWKGGRVHLISSGNGGDDSYLASSSGEGEEVFFLTRQRLLPSDHDASVDIYDARVGGGFPQAAEPTLCEGIEGCHGPATGPSVLGNPGSSTFSSAAARPDPSVKRLHKALKVCKHKKTKRAKVKCRAAAKRRYGELSMAAAPKPSVKRLHKALKVCKHKKTKRARVKCRAAAKRRYGKTSQGRAH